MGCDALAILCGLEVVTVQRECLFRVWESGQAVVAGRRGQVESSSSIQSVHVSVWSEDAAEVVPQLPPPWQKHRAKPFARMEYPQY